jgi:hypothetical protein
MTDDRDKVSPDPIKIKERNKDKKDLGPAGWCTEDLYFDEVGRLFVSNAALAAEIQRTFDTWGKRFCIFRAKTAEEKKEDEKKGGGGIGENKVNTMCSCTGP